MTKQNTKQVVCVCEQSAMGNQENGVSIKDDIKASARSYIDLSSTRTGAAIW